jgi:tRNA(Ile)-lysidine synthase
VAVSASLSNGKSRRIETAVRRAAAGKKLVLAVSGGRDSMALLHATARAAPRSLLTVATFDHGTGAAATRAAMLAAAEATRLGFPVVIGRASEPGTSEAEWRADRLRFLADVAARTGGAVATAHTRDDQVETILMRVLRDSGARGLAGLYAAGETVRPLLSCARVEVAAYAREVGARWVEDPTNASTRFLRNRVRRDLLPALSEAAPGFEDLMLDVARRAAALRDQVDEFIATLARVASNNRSVSVAALDLAGYSRAELAVLWPAIASRVGLTMDWRGTERAAAFTTESRMGARIQLTGGWEISRSRDGFELRRVSGAADLDTEKRLLPGMHWDGWRFHEARDLDALDLSRDANALDPSRDANASLDPWIAQLPANAPLTVRRWQPGDRMRFGADRMRKVKRFLSDARVSGVRRGQWPVVLAGDEIVWIPGVRRSDAAAVRPGRPGVLYRCELDDR